MVPPACSRAYDSLFFGGPPLSSNPEPASVRPTALNRVHRLMGARMVDFNGWEMPVEYPAQASAAAEQSAKPSGGLVAEHMIVRTSVGIFDVSHMGDIHIHGPQALAAVQHITMNDAAHLAVGQAQYSALLYPTGTFVDDVIVHCLAKDDFLLVINAGTREKDFDWVRDAARGFDCVAQDLSDRYYPDRHSRPQRLARPAKADRRRSQPSKVLLVHPRHRLRTAQHAHRPHRLHRRRRL